MARLAFLLLTLAAALHHAPRFLDRPPLPPVFESAFGWWVAIVVAAAQVAIGRGWARVAGRRLGGPGGRATAAALGIATTTAALLAVALLPLLPFLPLPPTAGSLGGFGTGAIAAATLAAAATTLLPRARPARLGGDLPRRSLARRAALVACVVAMALPYVVQTLLPDSDWDAALYHLPLADRLREGGALWTDALPLHAYYRPASMHLLYAALLEGGAGAAITPLNLLAVGGALAATAGLGRALGGRRAAPFGVAVAASTGLLLELGLDARVDAFLVLFAGVAALAATRTLKKGRASDLLAAAVAAGGCFATKYNGLPVAGALLAVLLPVWLVRARAPHPRRAAAAFVAVALALVPSGFWYLRNHALMNDAVYPFTHGALFVNRDGERVPLEGAFRAVPKRAKAPKRKVEYLTEVKETAEEDDRPRPSLLLLPRAVLDAERYVTKPLHRPSPFLLLFLFLPLLVRRLPAALLTAATLGAYAALATRSAELRYLAPLVPALAAGAGVAISRAPPRLGRVPAALGLGLLLVLNAVDEAAKTAAFRPLRYLGGKEDALSYLGRVGYNGEVHVPRLVKWLNDQVDAGRVPPDARVYMLAEAKGHRLVLPYTPTLSNSFAEFFVELKNFRMRRGKLAASLLERGYHFLLVNRGWVVWSVRHSAVDRPVLQATMHQLDLFLDKHCRLVARQGDISLYRFKETE
ncbi:MAG: glycosyltransferase family 39 protein [Planctomycetota bacterium JB042]